MNAKANQKNESMEILSTLETFIKGCETKYIHEWNVVYVWLSKANGEGKGKEYASHLKNVMNATPHTQGESVIMGNNDVFMLMRTPDGEKSETEQMVSTVTEVLDKILPSVEGELCKTFNLKNDFAQFVAAVTGVSLEKLEPYLKPSNKTIDSAKPGPSTKPIVKKVESDTEYAGEPHKTSKYAHLRDGSGARPSWEIGHAPFQSLEDERPSISPQQMAFVEHILLKVDISNFVRNQNVYQGCLVDGFQKYYEEIYVSIDFLNEHMKGKYAITADKWLFQYLTRTLDSRLMSTLGLGGDGEKKKFNYSINLNVQSILSEDFLKYDALLPIRTRKDQILEIQAFDFIENMNSFHYLRHFLRARGYRVCIDSVDGFLFDMVDWEKLDIDYIKIVWNKDYADHTPESFATRIPKMTKDLANTDVILCRCDDETAINWGTKLGITKFQGWYLDDNRRANTLKMKENMVE